MALIESREIKSFISISSEAELRKVVPAGTPGAVERFYDTKDEKGAVIKDEAGNPVQASKIEKLYESVSGVIKNIEFVNTKWGTLLQVTIVDPFLNDEEILSMATSESYAQDFMKKLPNIKLDKEVILKPYSFIPDGETKKKRGMTVTQDGIKLEKSFSEKKGDTWVATLGYPTPDPKLSKETNEMKRKEGWKRFFKDCEIFLVDYTTEHYVTKKADTVESLAQDMNEVTENF